MYGIDFLDDIYQKTNFSIYERNFHMYEVLKNEKYFGRLHHRFNYAELGETFTVYKYKSVEKHSMFDIEYIIELYVSDQKPKDHKAMSMLGVLGKGSIHIELAHDFIENSFIRDDALVVYSVIKEMRLNLLKETMVNLYEADRELMNRFFMENMNEEELSRCAGLHGYRKL